MLNEHVHKELQEIYDEFDRHSRITNTDYSIDADYPKLQGYTILDCPDFYGFLRHITNFVKNRPIDFRVNGSPVDYHQLEKLPKKRHNLVTFAVTPIQESDMDIKSKIKVKPKKKNLDIKAKELTPEQTKTRKQAEALRQKMAAKGFETETRISPAREEDEIMDENQYKFGDTKHARTQNPRLNSKNAHKRSAFEEISFDERLEKSLSEAAVVFTEPDVLFTQSSHAVEPETNEKEELESLKNELNVQIEKYLGILESTKNEITVAIAEDIIESCTERVNQINEVLNA